MRKLFQISLDLDETWHKQSLGNLGETDTAAFTIHHQGDRLFGAEGGNFAVLPFFKGF